MSCKRIVLSNAEVTFNKTISLGVCNCDALLEPQNVFSYPLQMLIHQLTAENPVTVKGKLIVLLPAEVVGFERSTVSTRCGIPKST